MTYIITFFRILLYVFGCVRTYPATIYCANHLTERSLQVSAPEHLSAIAQHPWPPDLR